jgi:hypothetical protein
MKMQRMVATGSSPPVLSRPADGVEDGDAPTDKRVPAAPFGRAKRAYDTSRIAGTVSTAAKVARNPRVMIFSA